MPWMDLALSPLLTSTMQPINTTLHNAHESQSYDVSVLPLTIHCFLISSLDLVYICPQLINPLS